MLYTYFWPTLYIYYIQTDHLMNTLNLYLSNFFKVQDLYT